MHKIVKTISALNFTAMDCNIHFCTDRRLVLLDLTDATGAHVSVSLHEPVMARITGEFLKVRLFGLH